MNWKTDLKLADLDPATRIEVTCKHCGLSRYEQQASLMQRAELKQAYLDEVERALRCSNRFCKGAVRVALSHDDKTEGFVGGMA
jgi:transcription elongation factor Elf1